ncbi:MAG: HIT family protein [Actinomycetota bacterium]|nr:HIT family protein [Actinomycetota bacterium]
MPDCLFCRIVAGDEPAHVVLDDEACFAFLDVRPLFHGHTLLVPREHHETLADLPRGLIEPFFARAQRLSVAVRDARGAQGSFVAMNNVVSQSVPHLHCHIVPRVKKDGLRGFFWPRTKYASDEEAAEVAGSIRSALA